MIKWVCAECSPLFQLIKLLNNIRTDLTDVILEKIITKRESYGRLSYSVINKTYLNAYDDMTQFVELKTVLCVKENNVIK